MTKLDNRKMLLLRYALLILVLFWMPPVLGAQDLESESRLENVPTTTVTVQDVSSDSAIRERLSSIFQSAGWFRDLDVSSENGIVTIKGFADNEEHSQWATSVARKTEDVIAVINKLEIEATIDLSSSKNVVQDSLNKLWRDFLVRSPLLIAALGILCFTAIVAKLTNWVLRRIIDRRSIRSSLKDLIYQLASIAVWIAGVLTATVVAFPGMTPSKALTVLGLGSVAIGFAFKDIFENFFAGILILWRYPFDRGDFITCGDVTGKVEQVTIRNTMIRRLDGELTVMPNATIFKNNVDVLTSQPQRRVRILCGVAYDENVDEAREVITKAVESCDSVEGIRTIEVFANEFADSSVNFEIAWWTGSKPTEIRRSRDEIIATVKRALEEAGIEIPFPYRTLTFKDSDINARDLLATEAKEL